MTATKRTARDRLLDAAAELFYAEGIHTVGIDRVIQHAGVAKASLYNSFGSKDGLIRAYLCSRQELVRDRITRASGEHDDPRKKILAVFAAQAGSSPSPTTAAARSPTPRPSPSAAASSRRSPIRIAPGCWQLSSSWRRMPARPTRPCSAASC